MYEPDFGDLHARLLKEGGFCFLPCTGEFLESGGEGYSVENPESKEEVPHPCTVSALRDFYQRNLEAFDDGEAFDAYWLDGFDHLMVATVLEDEKDAFKLARGLGLESIFSFADGTAVQVLRRGQHA